MILSEIRILEEKMAKPIRNRDSASLLYLGLYFELLRIAEIGSFIWSSYIVEHCTRKSTQRTDPMLIQY